MGSWKNKLLCFAKRSYQNTYPKREMPQLKKQFLPLKKKRQKNVFGTIVMIELHCISCDCYLFLAGRIVPSRYKTAASSFKKTYTENSARPVSNSQKVETIIPVSSNSTLDLHTLASGQGNCACAFLWKSLTFKTIAGWYSKFQCSTIFIGIRENINESTSNIDILRPRCYFNFDL